MGGVCRVFPQDAGISGCNLGGSRFLTRSLALWFYNCLRNWAGERGPGCPGKVGDRNCEGARLPVDAPLLLIVLDDLRRTNFRLVRIESEVAKSTSLAQEVPTLIQLNLDFLEPSKVGLGKFPLQVQSVFLFDEVLNVIEDRLILDLILHENLLQQGRDRNN
jgi:hypothetical protein